MLILNLIRINFFQSRNKPFYCSICRNNKGIQKHSITSLTSKTQTYNDFGFGFDMSTKIKTPLPWQECVFQAGASPLADLKSLLLYET